MMRAKMQVNEVIVRQGSEVLKMAPVCSSGFGPKGESEDNTYARYTPGGSLELTISNPDLHGKFKPGQQFYLDFTPADQPAAGE